MASPLSFPEMQELTSLILRECYAQDIIDGSEYERRLTILNKAQTNRELEGLINDLPVDLPAVIQRASAPLLHRKRSQNISVIFGDQKVAGERLNCRHTEASIVFGDVTLDFRDVELPPGVTTLKVTSVLSDTKIIIPPELCVDMDVTSFMGTVREPKDANVYPRGNDPVLRITGIAVLSEVKVKIKVL
jgi:hypothetical protein